MRRISKSKEIKKKVLRKVSKESIDREKTD